MSRKEKILKIGEFEYTESELYENEEDRNRILSLNELERETILSDRVQKLLQEKERASLLKKKSDLNSNNNIRKKDALEEIRLRRFQRQNKDNDKNDRNLDDNVSSFSSESESGEINDEDHHKGKKKAHSSDEDYSMSDSSGRQKEKKKNAKRNRSDSSSYSLSISDDDEKKKKKGETFLSLSDLERVKISRGFIEKYWEKPIFDKKIEGCFVKININEKSLSGNGGYLLGQIKTVVDNKDKPVYMLEKKPCTKYLIVAHAHQEKAIALNIVSNNLLTEVEFRIWRDRMEKFKIPMPKLDQIKTYIDNIECIKNYQYSQDELNDMINKKREMKIKNQDRRINITLELSVLNEEFNSAKQKFNETREEKYAIRLEQLTPKIENLTKMAKDRERDDFEKAEVDQIGQINKRNLQKQKLNYIENSLQNRKKRKESNVVNPYKRRDCNPINLFDSGYLNKAEIKEEQRLEEITDKYSNEEEAISSLGDINQIKNWKINEIMRYVKRFSEELEEVIKSKKEKLRDVKFQEDVDEKKFFSLLGIKRNHLCDLIKTHNSKFEKGDFKLLSLDQLEY